MHEIKQAMRLEMKKSQKKMPPSEVTVVGYLHLRDFDVASAEAGDSGAEEEARTDEDDAEVTAVVAVLSC